jgi:hypothetical protein
MRLVLRPGGRSHAWVAALLIVAAAASLHARRELTEQELKARIDSEGNPTKKAKLEIKLGRLKLDQAIAAYDGNQFDAGPKLLDAYRGCMRQAWELLEKSGRDAGRKPQGFKDLDIALRESARRLNDLKMRTPYEDRGNIEAVATEIDTLHAKVLTALFPGGQLGGPSKQSVPPVPVKPAGPQSLAVPGEHP